MTIAVVEPGIDFADPGLPRRLPLAFDGLRARDATLVVRTYRALRVRLVAG